MNAGPDDIVPQPGRIGRIPVKVAALAAGLLPADRQQECIDEWTGELAYMERWAEQISYAVCLFPGIPRLWWIFANNDAGLIAGIEQGSKNPAELAERFLAVADSAQLDSLPVFRFAVRGLCTANAATVAEYLAAKGQRGLALVWTDRYLRLERMLGRQPDDVVTLFRRLRRFWPNDLPGLREELKPITDLWSVPAQQQVEYLLDQELRAEPG